MSQWDSLQTSVNWFIQALLQDTRLRMNFEMTYLRTAASATHQQHRTPSEKAASLIGAVKVRRRQCELLPYCWAAHVELFARCLYGPALHLVRSKVIPPGVSGDIQTSEDRQNIWCWRLRPQEGFCLLCYDSFVSPPSEKIKSAMKGITGVQFP